MHYCRINMLILRLLLVTSMASSGMCNFKLLLLHTSDMHSRYDEVNIHTGRCQDSTSKRCYGGFARIRAEVDRLREEAKTRGVPTIYLDSGDVLGESIYHTLYLWRLASRMMNLLKPDVMSLGSREFDNGVHPLASYIRSLQVPVVCSNIDASKEPSMQYSGNKIVPSVILDNPLLKGNKVAVIGYTSTHIPSDNIGKLQILDEMKALETEAARLKKEKNVKVVIALGHAGYYKDKEIAQKLDNIDVIVGGRSHYFLYSGKPPSIEKPDGPYPTVIKKGKKKIPILHASFGTKYLGRVELEFNDKGEVIKYTGQPILLTGEMPKDQAITDVLFVYKNEVRNKYQNALGKTDVLLDGKDSICRFQECNIGNMIADAFMYVVNTFYRNEDGSTVAHFGLIHSGDINASLYTKSDDYTGDIVMQDLAMVLPFSRFLTIIQLQGKVVREVLESSMKTYDPDNGGLFKACLMQVSGLRVQYDLTKPQGQRVTGVQLAPDYKELNHDLYYNVVTTDFLAKGGDKVQCITNLENLPKATLADLDYLVVGLYIQKHTPLTADAYNKQGRISIIEPKGSKAWQFISKFVTNIRDRIKAILGRLSPIKKG